MRIPVMRLFFSLFPLSMMLYGCSNSLRVTLDETGLGYAPISSIVISALPGMSESSYTDVGYYAHFDSKVEAWIADQCDPASTSCLEALGFDCSNDDTSECTYAGNIEVHREDSQQGVKKEILISIAYAPNLVVSHIVEVTKLNGNGDVLED